MCITCIWCRIVLPWTAVSLNLSVNGLYDHPICPWIKKKRDFGFYNSRQHLCNFDQIHEVCGECTADLILTSSGSALHSDGMVILHSYAIYAILGVVLISLLLSKIYLFTWMSQLQREVWYIFVCECIHSHMRVDRKSMSNSASFVFLLRRIC